MAFAESIAPRRKTTTYGRHSRRYISTMSSATQTEFAQDAGASILGPKGFHRRWQGYGRHESSNLLHARSGAEHLRDTSACQESCSKLVPKDQLRSLPGRTDSTKDNSLYDVPLSDDDLGQNATATRITRKVLPSKTFTGKRSPVYDDESLQKHIAAEARRDEGQNVQLPNITSAAQDFDSEAWAVDNQAAARERFSKGMSKTTQYSLLNPEHKIIDSKAVEQTKDASVARKQIKAILRAKVTSHQMQNTREDPTKTIVRPTTPDAVFDSVYSQDAASDPNSSLASSKSVYQFTTPPRSTNVRGGATTPRQRELWSRLLLNNAQVKSPSSPGLPAFTIGETRPDRSRGRAKRRRVSCGSRQQPKILSARSKKIIDTLHQSEQDPDRFSNDCDETLGSSSSDNKSEDIHSEASAADGAITVRTSPSAACQGLVSQFQDQSSIASQTVPSLFGGCPKVTYARQRSYLTDNDLEEAAMIGLPVPPEARDSREHGRRRLEDPSARTQMMKSVSGDFGDLPDSQGGTMRSIHELREAGGNVRLVSELEAILDDIGNYQPGSTSLRRRRLIDLSTKLEEPANCHRFVDQGLESRLIASAGLDDDLITNGLLVAALLQLISCSSSTLLLRQVGDVRVVSFLIDLLGSDEDLLSCARLRGHNMSKAALADLNILCSALLRSAVWRAGKPSVLSCHVLSLQCLEYLVRQTKEAGPLSEVLSAHAIRRIVTTSVPPFSMPPPQPGEIAVVSLELAVSILESCTFNNAAECQAPLWAGAALERVIGLLPLLSLCKGENCGSSRTLTLRLYLNLTNNSPSLCEDLSTPEVISVMFRIVISHFEQLAGGTLDINKTLVLDDLILTLGSLINLADLSKIARQLMMNLSYKGQSYLDTLLELFMNKFKNAAEVRIFATIQ